jgi:hypothetical protein
VIINYCKQPSRAYRRLGGPSWHTREGPAQIVVAGWAAANAISGNMGVFMGRFPGPLLTYISLHPAIVLFERFSQPHPSFHGL